MNRLSVVVTVVMAVLILTLVWLGLYPQPVLDTNASAIRGLQQDVASPAALPSASVDLPKDQTVEPRRENGDGLLTGKLNPGHLLRNQSPFSAGGAP